MNHGKKGSSKDQRKPALASRGIASGDVAVPEPAREANTVSFATLPPYRMGPYRLRIVASPREAFTDKRRKVEADWNSGLVLIRRDTTEASALQFLVRHLITAIHYRSGLNDASDEESFAHSFASGLVELALGQREFFTQFLDLIERLIKPGAGWKNAYLRGRSVAAPKRIICGAQACTIEFVASEHFGKARAYGFYTVGRGIIELSDSLSGANLAVVALHEKLHFMHECAGLEDASTEAMFKTGQTKLLLDSLKNNPGYWRWWMSLLSQNAA
jgi:hypothetical protein